MQEQETGQKTTIKTAADDLGVSTKTIQRYIAKGLLTKIKDGTRTYLLVSELKALSAEVQSGQERPLARDKPPHPSGPMKDVVVLDRERYDCLLLELGELRKRDELFQQLRIQLDAQVQVLRDTQKDMEQIKSRINALEVRDKDKVKAPKESPQPSTPVQTPATSSQPVKPTKPWWQK